MAALFERPINQPASEQLDGRAASLSSPRRSPSSIRQVSPLPPPLTTSYDLSNGLWFVDEVGFIQSRSRMQYPKMPRPVAHTSHGLFTLLAEKACSERLWPSPCRGTEIQSSQCRDTMKTDTETYGRGKSDMLQSGLKIEPGTE